MRPKAKERMSLKANAITWMVITITITKVFPSEPQTRSRHRHVVEELTWVRQYRLNWLHTWVSVAANSACMRVSVSHWSPFRKCPGFKCSVPIRWNHLCGL